MAFQVQSSTTSQSRRDPDTRTLPFNDDEQQRAYEFQIVKLRRDLRAAEARCRVLQEQNHALMAEIITGPAKTALSATVLESWPARTGGKACGAWDSAEKVVAWFGRLTEGGKNSDGEREDRRGSSGCRHVGRGWRRGTLVV